VAQGRSRVRSILAGIELEVWTRAAGSGARGIPDIIKVATLVIPGIPPVGDPL